MRVANKGKEVYCTMSSGHIDFKPENKDMMMELVSVLLDSGTDVCIRQDCDGFYMVDYIAQEDQEDGAFFETVTDMRSDL